MPLRILIVHEFGVTRKITHGYIMTEFSGAAADMAASPEEAATLLENEKYDVVLCGLEMANMDGLALFDHMRATETNRDTSFVIMTASYDEGLHRRLANRGIHHILPIPFTTLQLRKTITEARDPRRSRVFPRFIIPGAKALLQIPKIDVISEVLNISMNGMLCKFTHPDEPLDLLHPCELSIQFPSDYGALNTGFITSSMLRLSVESWRKNNSPQDLRAAWRFLHLPETAQRVLTIALEKAHKEMLSIEEAMSRVE